MNVLNASILGLLIALAGIAIYLAVALSRAKASREALVNLTFANRAFWPTEEPRRKVYACDFAGDTPDERLTEALVWAQTQATPPMIVMEDGVTHFRTVRVYNGVRLTTEGQR